MWIKTLILLMLTCSVAHAELRQTNELQSIKREIFASPKDTLVIFDVDFVLLTTTDEIFLITTTEEGQKHLSSIYDDLWQRLPKHAVDEIHTTLISTQQWRLVTADTAQIFNQIQSKGYKVLGLTAMMTGSIGIIPSMESWRIEQLKNVGIVFDKTFINAKPGALDPYIPGIIEHYSKAKYPSFSTVNDGIIFTTTLPKGEVLQAYLQYANIKPKKIIFIDDRLYNLESVQKYCQKFGIEFLGFEYIAVKEQAKNIKLNKRRAALQYKILELTKTWLNDTKADELLAIIE